jgi:hypothetical protein
MSYKIQRLGLGGVLDQAIAITRDNFRLLISIMLLLLVPFSLIVGFITLAITPALPPHPSADDMAAWRAAQASHRPFYALVGTIGVLCIYPITNAAVIQAVARLYLGKPTTAIDAFKHGIKRFGPLIWTSILMYLAIMGGFILLFIPGIYFSIWFGLSQHVTVIEEVSGPAALGRSKRLVNPNRGAFLLLGIILMVISYAVNLLSNQITSPLLRVLVSTGIQAGFTVFWTACLVVFYFSCRCAVENFDLLHLAQSIGTTPPSPEPGAVVSPAS